MTRDYEFYLMGKKRGVERALEIVTRRDVDPATVKWLVKLRDEISQKLMGEEE